MANVLVEKQSLIDTADAIRTQLESQDLITPENFATEILKIGGGGVKPTTWAELAAMGTTDLQAVYPEHSIIDLDCYVQRPNSATATDNWKWQVMRYGTCELENDNTQYPCVELLAQDLTNINFPFDVGEAQACDSTTETTAMDGVFYYGTTTASGTVNTSNTSALGLSTGDALPWDTYPRIWKSSLALTNQNFVNAYNYGHNNYGLSNVRQWLNANAAGGSWYTPSHVGDTLGTTYQNYHGLLYCLPDDFKSVLAKSKIEVATNTVTDGGVTDVMYDKLYLPSQYEMRVVATPVEGDVYTGITKVTDRCKQAINTAAFPNSNGGSYWWLRSAYRSIVNTVYFINYYGSAYSNSASNVYAVAPACKIILAS